MIGHWDGPSHALQKHDPRFLDISLAFETCDDEYFAFCFKRRCQIRLLAKMNVAQYQDYKFVH